MEKIESLTEHQKSLLTEYRDKWMEIGLSCEPANRELAEKWCREAYIIGGKQPPKQIIWADSPLSGALVHHILKNNLVVGQSVGLSVRQSVGLSVEQSVEQSVGQSIKQSVWQSVWQSVEQSVGQSIKQSVWQSVGLSVRQSVRQSVGLSVEQSVRQSVWQSVGQSVELSVRQSVRQSVWQSVEQSVEQSIKQSVWQSVWKSVGQSVWQSVYGQHNAHWLGYFNYFLEVCKLQSCEKLIPLMEHSKNCGWWIPCKNVAILQEKTRTVQLKEGSIHCETGPAIAYADGFEVYGLNGIRVPKEIVVTPADKLDAQLVLKEQNADIRREIVRKIGVPRLLKELNAKVIDTWKDYELLMLDLGDGRYRPYLKMINPSIGTVHVEGIEPGIKTVKHALAWRNGLKEFIEPIWIS